LQISFQKQSDGARKAVVRAKGTNENEKSVYLRGLPVDFYFSKGNIQSFIEKDSTDNDGNAVLIITNKVPADSEGKINITAKTEGSNNYAPAEVSGSVKDANLTLSVNADSSAKSLMAKIVQVDTNGTSVPLKDIEVTFYLRRLFGLMKLGDDAVTTDANGIALVEVPVNLKGDSEGMITIVARIEDNDIYGNIESVVSAKLGIPVPAENNPLPRAFYSARVPIWMLISFIFIIIGISCTILFVLYQLYRIKKEKPSE
jgi:hypothetical protein